MTTIPLLSERHWSQIRQKAGSPHFAPALRRLRDEAQDFLARPVAVPNRPGGYYHDYFCPQHAVQLIFEPDSPHVHRCPVGGETFSGEPFDAAWRWFVNDRLAQAALRLAILWQLEGEDGYRQQVQKILSDYASNYAGYAKIPPRTPNPGVATYTTLDESVWAIPLAWSFDLIRATLSRSEQMTVIERLLLPIAEHLVAHHFGGIHNFACWHNAAIGTLGVVTGHDDLIAFAIDGPYGFRTQVQDGILADGLWFEGSFSYHFYTVAALFSLAKATANLPEWDLRQETALTSVLRAPVLCAYPDGGLPATNDCWYFTGLIDDCCHGVPKAPAFYEIGYAWFDDMLFGQVLARAYRHGPRDSLDALLFGAQTLPTDGVPALSSVHMPASGYAILRSQPEEQGQPAAESESDQHSQDFGATIQESSEVAPSDADVQPLCDQQYIFLKYGPHGGGHGHPDKLGLSIFAHGRRQSPDLGTPGYGIDLFESWYRQTVSHNTVLLDGLSQPPGAGKINAFRADGPFQIADASADWSDGEPSPLAEISARFDSEDLPDAYAQVRMRRAVLARAGYFLDVFLVRCGAERRIDWIYRNAGELAAIPDAHPLGRAAIEGEGYEHIADVHSLALDNDVSLTWQLERLGMQIFMDDRSGATLIAGRAPGNPADDRQGLIIRRRVTSQTAFLTIFHPYRNAPQITSVTWHGRDLLGMGWAACTVGRAKRRDRWIIRLRQQVKVPSWLAELPADNQFEYILES